MTDLRTHAEYLTIAQDLNLPCNAYIDGKQALLAAREIRAGTVTINCYGEGDITTPFGGYKQSGFGGRDNSLHAHDQYTESKAIWVDLSDRHQVDLVE